MSPTARSRPAGGGSENEMRAGDSSSTTIPQARTALTEAEAAGGGSR